MPTSSATPSASAVPSSAIPAHASAARSSTSAAAAGVPFRTVAAGAGFREPALFPFGATFLGAAAGVFALMGTLMRVGGPVPAVVDRPVCRARVRRARRRARRGGAAEGRGDRPARSAAVWSAARPHDRGLRHHHRRHPAAAARSLCDAGVRRRAAGWLHGGGVQPRPPGERPIRVEPRQPVPHGRHGHRAARVARADCASARSRRLAAVPHHGDAWCSWDCSRSIWRGRWDSVRSRCSGSSGRRPRHRPVSV